MAGYPTDLHVTVRPFAHRIEGDEAIIGDVERQVFLAVPTEGVALLTDLAEGRTVAEAARRYEERHGDRPDMDDFLDALAAQGFVSVGAPGAEEHVHAPGATVRRRWTFDWIPQDTARRLCGPPVLAGCAAVVLVAFVLVVLDPGILPGPTTLLFVDGHFAALTWATTGLAFLAVLVHEFAHAVAARAAGASASLGIGNLMYTLVAQTDVTGMWLASKRQRYLAFVAGLITDLVGASLLVAVLWAERRGFIALSDDVWRPLLSAFLFTYLLRITWQFLFYLRTDIYYVVAAARDSRDLMADTEQFLRNTLYRMLRRPVWVVDQSGLPAREMRTVRWYAGLWMLGRAFELMVLVFLYLPLLLGYLGQFGLLIVGGDYRFTPVDFVTVAVLAFLIEGGGIYLWVRSGVRALRRTRATGTVRAA